MLDPLTAIGLASSIVQFVDFSGKVLSKARELSQSRRGSTTDAYAAVPRDLLQLSEKLRDGLRTARQDESPSESDKALEALCDRCIGVSEKMLARLENLRVGQDDSKWKVVLQAARTVWSKKELDELSDQLDVFRSQLQLRVFVSFRYVNLQYFECHCNLTFNRENYDLAGLSVQQQMDECSKQIIAALRDFRDVFESISETQTQVMFNLHQETQSTIADEHATTRSVIVNAVNEASRQAHGRRRRIIVEETGARTVEQELEIIQLAEDRILRSLLFPSIAARYSQVAKAHATTFEWALKEQLPGNREGSGFSEWLKSGHGIYWINGKAGSGKSTLMRYLYDHDLTRKHLASWSNSRPLDLAAFFFWNSGTSEQKSQIGLLRSLLHEILSKHRELIPCVLPGLWRDEYVKPTEYIQDIEWSLYNLKEALDLLSSETDLRMCLFIDGLDEYEGDRDGTFADIIALFKGMAASTNIKICVSSRPWLVFEDAFRLIPNLRLQDLTYNDIQRYVQDKLDEHPRMTQLRKLNSENVIGLVNEIVTKASGVFLWVILVVKSLLDGLTNRDRLSDLQKRLRLLPSDLKDLYQHMLLKHINPFYHQQASQIFQIVRAAKNGVHDNPEDLELLTLAFADEEDEDYVFKAEVKPLSDNDLAFKCSEMADRLKSRCAGLLEVSGDLSDPLDLKVNYLHRTVQDFLQTPEIWDMILNDSGEAFEPNECLVKSYILQLKLVMVSESEDNFTEVSRLVRTALAFAYKSRSPNHALNLKILDELDNATMTHWMSVPRSGERYDPKNEMARLRNLCRSDGHWARYLQDVDRIANDNFLCLAIGYGLTEYVVAELKKDDLLVEKKNGRPLLDYIASVLVPPEPEIVRLLLRNNAHPNKQFQGRSMWQRTIAYVDRSLTEHGIYPTQFETKWMAQWRIIFKQLLEAGVDPHAIGTWIKKDRRGAPATPDGPQATICLPTLYSVVSELDDAHNPELKDIVISLKAVEEYSSLTMPLLQLDRPDADAYVEAKIAAHLRKSSRSLGHTQRIALSVTSKLLSPTSEIEARAEEISPEFSDVITRTSERKRFSFSWLKKLGKSKE